MSVASVRTSLGHAPRPASKLVAQGISPLAFYLIVGALLLTNAITVTGFAMSGDIARLWSGKNDLVMAAYEARIADLRSEVDKLYSRQYARAGDINLQLQDLAQQQETLSAQHQYVRALAGMAKELGVQLPKTAPATAELTAPQPAARPADRPQLSAVRSAIERMKNDNTAALDHIETGVEASTDRLLAGLDKIGLAPRFADVSRQTAMGGPFEPSDTGAASAMLQRANGLYEQFMQFKSARDTLRSAPVYAPLKGRMRISSPFGTRRDPFVQTSAFHSGMDFPKPMGTPVMAAGDGTIAFAGRQSGYGNLIEIRHANGLSTRYGHLSAILVRNGQTVASGEVIGKVGSTGRSTGPHLHFEVRRGNGPINPNEFLRVGRSLSAFL